MKRKLKFNVKHFDGATHAQQELLDGTAKCAARWGTRAVQKTDCSAPVTMLRQEGRRRWVISGFCDVHGSLTRELSIRESVYESWAMLSDVLEDAKLEARVRAALS